MIHVNFFYIALTFCGRQQTSHVKTICVQYILFIVSLVGVESKALFIILCHYQRFFWEFIGAELAGGMK